MIEIKNQFARNILFWIVTLPVLFLLLAPVMLDSEDFKVPAEEIQTLKTLGRDTKAITEQANAIFRSAFVDTGAVAYSHSLLTTATPITQHGVKVAADVSNSYVLGFWHLVYRAVWRIAGLWPVLSVLLLCVVLPAIVDGLAIRGRKLDQFRQHNPVIFWASAHSAISVAGVFMILPLLPIPISVTVLYLAVAGVALSLWTTASNLQTGT
jgi:hypothetical protein